MSLNLAACSPVTRLPFLLPLLPVMFQFPGISSTPLGKTCISKSQRLSALWNPTPRLLFLLGTIPPSPATDSSLKPQESNPSPRPTYTASAAGPLPTVPCPLPRASPCPLTGVGLQQHLCLSQDLLGPVLGAVRPGQEALKVGIELGLLSLAKFLLRELRAGGRGEHSGVDDSAGGKGGPALPHPSTPPAWLELRP